MPEIEQVCPNCGEIYKAPSEWIGGKVECPACKTAFTVVGTTARAPSGKTPSFRPFATGLAVLMMLGIALLVVFLLMRHRPEVYKGIWMPTLILQDPNYLSSNIQKLKDIGINTIFIVGIPPQAELWLEKAKKAKEVFPPELAERFEEILPIQVQKEIIINHIQTAHRNGLKVGLTIVNFPHEMKDLLDIELLNSTIIEYARLAEEYDVELFAPMSEPEHIFGGNVEEWSQEILHKIKEVYHGEVVWKGAWPALSEKQVSKKFLKELSEAPPGHLSGYDYIGFSSFYRPSEGLTPEERSRFADQLTLENYSESVDNALKYKLAQAERHGCKGVMISEFGVSERGLLSEEDAARAHEIVLERGKDKVVGFFAVSFFLGANLPGVDIGEKLKTQEVIKRWYTELLQAKKVNNLNLK